MKNQVLNILLILLINTLLFSQSNSKQTNLTNSVSTLPISVTIGGEFIVTGSFPAFSGERVDQFVTRIFNETRSQLNIPQMNERLFLTMLSEFNEYPLRGIKLLRKGGEEIVIDLLKFRLTGDFHHNPYLMNDDVIVFPAYNKKLDFIEINGAVNKPIKFQYQQNDKLSDALFFARGISSAYENVDSALISRLSYDGNYEKTIKVGIDEQFKLQKGDRIKVLAEQSNRENYKVLVLGEVKNPGSIFITKDNTTIQQVISKAGGFTNNADLRNAELVRNFNREQTLKKYALEQKAKEKPEEYVPTEKDANYWQALETLKMYRTADLLFDDTLFFNISNQLRMLNNSKLVDFTTIDSIGSSTAEFIVKDGDVIIIPERFDAVYVFGQVGKAGYYDYKEGKLHDFYINKAGGLASTAKDDDEIYIIKGVSREWISVEEDYKIEAGDFIYVLKEWPLNVWWYVGRVGAVASILGSIAAVVLLFK